MEDMSPDEIGFSVGGGNAARLEPALLDAVSLKSGVERFADVMSQLMTAGWLVTVRPAMLPWIAIATGIVFCNGLFDFVAAATGRDPGVVSGDERDLLICASREAFERTASDCAASTKAGRIFWIRCMPLNTTQYVVFPGGRRELPDPDCVDFAAIADALPWISVRQLIAPEWSLLRMDFGTIHRGIANRSADDRTMFRISVKRRGELPPSRRCKRSGGWAWTSLRRLVGENQAMEKVRCSWAGKDPQMLAYHDEEWGVPEYDSRTLWEKLMLDGFQAGLSLVNHPAETRCFPEGVSEFRSEKSRPLPTNTMWTAFFRTPASSVPAPK